MSKRAKKKSAAASPAEPSLARTLDAARKRLARLKSAKAEHPTAGPTFDIYIRDTEARIAALEKKS